MKQNYLKQLIKTVIFSVILTCIQWNIASAEPANSGESLWDAYRQEKEELCRLDRLMKKDLILKAI